MNWIWGIILLFNLCSVFNFFCWWVIGIYYKNEIVNCCVWGVILKFIVMMCFRVMYVGLRKRCRVKELLFLVC